MRPPSAAIPPFGDVSSSIGPAPLNSLPWLGLERYCTMASDPKEVKHSTGPVTLYEVAAVRESLSMALAEGSRSGSTLATRARGTWPALQLLVSCVKPHATGIGRHA